jgi:mRNA-degrading endonuclease RelE of RelBE toxin-antitoxin system
MREYFVEKQLKKKLRVLFKKNKARYVILLKKIEEVVSCDDIDHYKNLRAPLQHLKRVHIDSHFVLVFRYDPTSDTVFFYNLDHHDNIYK